MRPALTCRVGSGASYTLSDGNQGFDGSGHIAQEWADSRVFVTSAVAGESFTRALADASGEATFPCPVT